MKTTKPTISKAELSDELLKYFWPFPYPEHLPPIEVVFSNGLPERAPDPDHMIFQIPFSTFKTAIEALIADQQRQLLDRVEAELPEKKNYIDFEDEVTDKLDATYVGGINEVLTDVHRVIKDIREGV